MENERKMYQDMERIFFTKEQIAEAVKGLCCLCLGRGDDMGVDIAGGAGLCMA